MKSSREKIIHPGAGNLPVDSANGTIQDYGVWLQKQCPRSYHHIFHSTSSLLCIPLVEHPWLLHGLQADTQCLISPPCARTSPFVGNYASEGLQASTVTMTYQEKRMGSRKEPEKGPTQTHRYTLHRP